MDANNAQLVLYNSTRFVLYCLRPCRRFELIRLHRQHYQIVSNRFSLKTYSLDVPQSLFTGHITKGKHPRETATLMAHNRTPRANHLLDVRRPCIRATCRLLRSAYVDLYEDLPL
jgi:hypothetical protein